MAILKSAVVLGDVNVSGESRLLNNLTVDGSLTVGNIQCYGSLYIASNTDQSASDEPIILTAGYGMSNATKSNGLAIGKDYLFWKNKVKFDSSGNIHYNGTKSDYSMIKFIDNTADTYGNGISIGGGGITIIGAGESNDIISSKFSAGDENMYIGADENVRIYSNLQSGWDSRKEMVFNSSGNLGIGTTTPTHKLQVSGGLVSITNNSNTVIIGSQNGSYCHIQNTADIPFYFNKNIVAEGNVQPYTATSASRNLGTDSAIWTTTHTKQCIVQNDANNKCTMQYDSTEECMKFVFA